ncbi:MAG: hypothetical protein ACKVJE_07195 [Pseudomonadales bacterium]
MTNPTLASAVKTAESAWEAWNTLGATARVALLSIAAKELNQPLVNWLLSRVTNTMPDTVHLPGPTGEANSLHWSGRGLIGICSGTPPSQDDETVLAYETAIAAQLFTALATGNTVVLQSSNTYMHRLHSALLNVGVPADVVQISSASIEELARHEAFHAYAFCGQVADVIALNTQLAQRDGMLAQLIAETDFNAYATLTSLDYSWRFVTESTLSVNTTAVGGNATLLELGGKSDS